MLGHVNAGVSARMLKNWSETASPTAFLKILLLKLILAGLRVRNTGSLVRLVKWLRGFSSIVRGLGSGRRPICIPHRWAPLRALGAGSDTSGERRATPVEGWTGQGGARRLQAVAHCAGRGVRKQLALERHCSWNPAKTRSSTRCSTMLEGSLRNPVSLVRDTMFGSGQFGEGRRTTAWNDSRSGAH